MQSYPVFSQDGLWLSGPCVCVSVCSRMCTHPHAGLFLCLPLSLRAVTKSGGTGESVSMCLCPDLCAWVLAGEPVAVCPCLPFWGASPLCPVML